MASVVKCLVSFDKGLQSFYGPLWIFWENGLFFAGLLCLNACILRVLLGLLGLYGAARAF